MDSNGRLTNDERAVPRSLCSACSRQGCPLVGALVTIGRYASPANDVDVVTRGNNQGPIPWNVIGREAGRPHASAISAAVPGWRGDALAVPHDALGCIKRATKTHNNTASKLINDAKPRPVRRSGKGSCADCKKTPMRIAVNPRVYRVEEGQPVVDARPTNNNCIPIDEPQVRVLRGKRTKITAEEYLGSHRHNSHNTQQQHRYNGAVKLLQRQCAQTCTRTALRSRRTVVRGG